MKKRILLLLTAICLLAGTCSVSASAAEADDPINIYLDNELVELSSPPLLINGTTYIPLRSFASALGATGITWNNVSSTATVTAPNLQLNVKIGCKYLQANDRFLCSPVETLLLNGTTLAPIRSVSTAFGADVIWQPETGDVYLHSNAAPLKNSSEIYTEEDLYWLSRIIYAEAGCESLEGQIAVGNVVLNRVASDLFPDTIYDVIFDFRYGTIQFSPAASGSVYRTPSEEAVLAAKLAMEGYDVAGDSLFFVANYLADSCWAAYNRPYNMTLGGHTFYA